MMDSAIEVMPTSRILKREAVEVKKDERTEYREYVSQIIDLIKKEAGGNEGWWVVAGVAKDALLNNQDFPVKSPEGEWRDIDLIFSTKLKSVGRKVQRLNRTPIHIGTSLQNAINVIPGKAASLEYGAHQHTIPPQVFETQMANFQGIEIPTLPAQTLLHLYGVGIRMYGMRKKDFQSALEIARYANRHPDSRYPHELYEEFHHFSRAKKYAPRTINDCILNVAKKYVESPVNRFLPINHPLVRPLVEKAWHSFGRAQQTLAKN